MKTGLLIVTSLGLALLIVVFATSDTRISDTPIQVAENAAIKSIESAGSDPVHWELDGECVAQGPCLVRMSPAAYPGEVVATDQYVTKDSRASVNGRSKIEALARLAVERDCFNQELSWPGLGACLSS
ncbi:MAG: hypothetical protein WBP55_05695 [Solirubrobacterales bacterium]